MGEQGLSDVNPSSRQDGFVNAAVAICPGYDIENCMGRVLEPYQNYVLGGVKNFHLHQNKGVLETCETFGQSMTADNLQTWLDFCWSMAGFSSKEEYYEATNPMKVDKHIKHPFLIIN